MTDSSEAPSGGVPQRASDMLLMMLQETLALAAPAPSLEALRSTSGLRMLRLCDASMLSNRITGASADPSPPQAWPLLYAIASVM